MGKFNPTEDQRKVIELRNCNVLVSAAAGSGKTAVLVERIWKKISSREHPVDIDRLLIVTFTEAAAGEMRERISRTIEERRLLEPGNAHLERQASLVHNAQITTIHSFCLGILRNYFNEIDLDPGFRLGDETELKLLKADVMEAVLEEFYKEASPEFLAFVESYATGKRDESIERMVYRFYDFAMSYPWPAQWIRGQKRNFCLKEKEDFYAADWQRELFSFLQAQVEDCLQENQAALRLCEEADGPYMYSTALCSDQEQLERLAGAESTQEIGRCLAAFSWERLSAKKDACVDPAKREQVKLLRNGIKKELQALQEKYFFQSEEEMIEDLQRVAPEMESLISLTLAFMEAYQAKKAERNLLDFDDLEHLALKILVEEPQEGSDTALPVKTPTAVELSNYYDEIMIDEYQDSNLVQELLLNSIAREKQGQASNLFMVGDVKQSIYKFRLARPELFMQKLESYKEEGACVRVALKKNFRSRESVLEAINYIFYGIMKKDLGNIQYDATTALYPGREDGQRAVGEQGLDDSCEVWLAQSSEEVSDQELEARLLARRMQQLNKEQGVPFQDMAILLRSMKGWAEEVAAVLREEGVPVRTATQTGYFSAIEVMTVLNLLLVIDNPRQDIPLAAVLRSPIGGFTDEELAVLRCLSPKGELYDCLEMAAVQGEQGLPEEKVKGFLRLLGELRGLVPILGIYELLTVIYEKTGYYNYVRALPGEASRCANLDMLLKKSADFEKTSYGGLFQFNRYIEKLHDYEVDFGEAEALNNSSDTAVIMSIHKSKGLEFPVVFLAGMGKGFNRQDSRERLLLHPELGIGPDYIDSTLRTKTPTLLKQVIKRKTELESMGEELRVLYVAMTRAREKLILTGCVRDFEKAEAKWEQGKQLLFSQRAGAGSYLDLIMPRIFTWRECRQGSRAEEEKGTGAGAVFLVSYATEEELALKTVISRAIGEEQRERLLALKNREVWSEEEAERMQRYLRYRYPYEREEAIKSKLTVSELKPSLPQQEEAYVPAFARKTQEVSGSFHGTVYHRVLEALSFCRAADSGVFGELQRLEEEGRITAEERALLSPKKLSTLLQSPLGERLRRAEKAQLLWREQPFVIGLPAKTVQPELESEETVLLQGVMDCFFEEPDGLVLLDYKTDRAEHPQELLQKYEAQLRYYGLALEQLTGKSVKECFLYSFSLEELIGVDFFRE